MIDTSAPPVPEKVPALYRLNRSVSRFFAEMLEPEVPWNRTTYTTFIALVVIWAALMYLTWASWGDLTVDSGHEMYVPAVLSEGKMLYRDVWYMHGPLAPYLNSMLFRIFGVRLEVLYWAGSLSALGSAAFLFLAGMRLGSWVIGWAAGAVVLIQAFEPWLFCFPLPYSFASVYGCLTACLFLWLVVRASTSKRQVWVFGAGTAAAAALLLKLEYGVSCYVALLLLILARSYRRQSWKPIPKDLLAVLPGVLVCVAVVGWMVSIAGVGFITQENYVSWPTTYFMKTYGKAWLELNGFIVSAAAFGQALVRTTVLAGVVLAFYGILRRTRSNWSSVFLAAEVCIIALAFLVPHLPWQAQAVFHWVFFPQDMVLIVSVTAIFAWWYFYRSLDRNAAVPLLFTFSALLAFRLLMGMQPTGYPIYYNGPVVLSFLLLVSRLIVPKGLRSRSLLHQSEVLVCFGCLVAATSFSNPFLALEKDLVPLTTERGTIRVSKHMAANYQAAIAFMKEENAAGESALSVPEDTSLYFLSGTHCPTRLYLFVPGVLVPGEMTEEMVQEMEDKHPRYLLWSNRTFPEYGVPLFGTDFDRPLGDYLRSHYRPLRPLVRNNDPGWDAVVWERMPEVGKSP
jgi:hypothetical protein